MATSKYCVLCGKEYTPRPSNYAKAKYCSAGCARFMKNYLEREKRNNQGRKIKEASFVEDERKRKKKMKPKESISDIQRKADALGLSYGMYEAYKRLGVI